MKSFQSGAVERLRERKQRERERERETERERVLPMKEMQWGRGGRHTEQDRCCFRVCCAARSVSLLWLRSTCWTSASWHHAFGSSWLEFLKTIICSVCVRSDIKAETHTACVIHAHTLVLSVAAAAPVLTGVLPQSLWIGFKKVALGNISAHSQSLTVGIYCSMNHKWGSCTNKTLVSFQALKLLKE